MTEGRASREQKERDSRKRKQQLQRFRAMHGLRVFGKRKVSLGRESGYCVALEECKMWSGRWGPRYRSGTDFVMPSNPGTED